MTCNIDQLIIQQMCSAEFFAAANNQVSSPLCRKMGSSKMETKYPEIGICGLSCRLCPTYNTKAKSKCDGCKSDHRMGAGCPFITCAIKKKKIEFCWECGDSNTCNKWSKHRNFGKRVGSFKCYQSLEQDITFIQKNDVDEFEKKQKIRHQLLKEMLENYNEGRSKSYYCIAVTVFQIDEIRNAISQANVESRGLNIKEKPKVLHSKLDNIAKTNDYLLKLRK